jgi:hypothetical protein
LYLNKSSGIVVNLEQPAKVLLKLAASTLYLNRLSGTDVIPVFLKMPLKLVTAVLLSNKPVGIEAILEQPEKVELKLVMLVLLLPNRPAGIEAKPVHL